MRMGIFIEDRVMNLALEKGMDSFVIRMKMKFIVDIGRIINTMVKEN